RHCFGRFPEVVDPHQHAGALVAIEEPAQAVEDAELEGVPRAGQGLRHDPSAGAVRRRGRERHIEQSRTQREQRSKDQQETESPRWPHRIDAPSDLDLHHLSPLSLGRLVRGRPGTSAASESYLYGPISGKSGWITGARAAASLAHISSSRKNGAMSTSGRVSTPGQPPRSPATSPTPLAQGLREPAQVPGTLGSRPPVHDGT